MTTHHPGAIRHAGDGWEDCACGHRHWGLFGAAGLLLGRHDDAGELSHVVLQHRALWSHQGGTWGVPGGAVAPGESSLEGALREAREEAGVPPEAVVAVGEHVLDHGTWRYTTVLAHLAPGAAVDVRPTDPESLAVAWIALDDVVERELLPAFAEAWPGLRRALTARP